MNRQVEHLIELDKISRKRLAKSTKDAAIRKIEKRIDPNILRYYYLRRERSGTALAPIEDGICLGCGMHYPDTNYVVRSMTTEVVYCEMCGRIVYPGKKRKKKVEPPPPKKKAAAGRKKTVTKKKAAGKKKTARTAAGRKKKVTTKKAAGKKKTARTAAGRKKKVTTKKAAGSKSTRAGSRGKEGTTRKKGVRGKKKKGKKKARGR